ncbi:hypothetical protein DFH27DRAFT_577827 [Peziza echinospora]|nr:hypothetical protein DFH27DRAFT_577827 [Peziza echinospora]
MRDVEYTFSSYFLPLRSLQSLHTYICIVEAFFFLHFTSHFHFHFTHTYTHTHSLTHSGSSSIGVGVGGGFGPMGWDCTALHCLLACLILLSYFTLCSLISLFIIL